MENTIQNFVHLNIHESSSKIPHTDEEWNQLKNIVMEAFIPKNTIIDSRSFTPADFTNVPNIVKPCFKLLQSIFIGFEPQYFYQISEAQRNCIYAIAVLCGEHSNENFWTTSSCVQLSEIVLKAVLDAFMCRDLSDLLCKSAFHDQSNCNSMFSFILPKLSQENWKYYPSMVGCFVWLLECSGRLEMKECITKVLPTTLNILQDYETNSKVIGLKCLYQIISKTPSADLERFIEIELLQNILKKLLHFREAELIVPAIECVLQLEGRVGFDNKSLFLKWSFCDEICNIFFPIMECEQNFERREQYIIGLMMLLKSGTAVRWLRKIINIIDNYSQTENTEYEAIKALNLCLKYCWFLLDMKWDKITLIAERILTISKNQMSREEAEKCLESLKRFPCDYNLSQLNEFHNY